MIKAASFKNYRIQEFIQFISNTLKIVQRHDPAKLKIEAWVSELTQQHGQLEAAFKQDTFSDITPQLTQLDDERDQAIVCLRKLSEGYTYYPDETLSAAGKKVMECIDKYGNKLYSLNYGAETATLKNLARDLQTDAECVAALKALRLEALVQQMNATNLKFEDLFIERLEESVQYDGKTTKELTQLTTEAYRILVQYISAHALLTPSDKYSSLINLINENIEHYNQLVERRKSSSEAEADTTAESETTPAG
ncbi:MAG: DUF6261 family protein [Cyclobacteriaceae bacterium]